MAPEHTQDPNEDAQLQAPLKPREKVRKRTTHVPMTPQKADAWNFNDLVRDLAYTVYWKVLKRRRKQDPMPVWQIEFKDVLEYTCPREKEPGVVDVITIRREIHLSGVDFYTALEDERMKGHRDHINRYLKRKPRSVRPSEKRAQFLLWQLSDEQIENTNKKRELNGSKPLTELERADLITRIQREIQREKRKTRHSVQNDGLVTGDWRKLPFFVEPPDLMHSDHAAQLLAWRQLLYLLMPFCPLSTHTEQRTLQDLVAEGITLEGTHE